MCINFAEKRNFFSLKLSTVFILFFIFSKIPKVRKTSTRQAKINIPPMCAKIQTQKINFFKKMHKFEKKFIKKMKKTRFFKSVYVIQFLKNLAMCIIFVAKRNFSKNET